MKRRRHTQEQIVRKLREADKLLSQGIAVPEVVQLNPDHRLSQQVDR